MIATEVDPNGGGSYTDIHHTDIFVAYDNLGAPRDDVDTTGTLVNHKVFSVFGQDVYDSNASIVNWACLGGGHADPNTGLVNDYHRWYGPATGRWLNSDPDGFGAGDPNLNRYVGNDPGGASDATGLDPNSQQNAQRQRWAQLQAQARQAAAEAGQKAAARFQARMQQMQQQMAYYAQQAQQRRARRRAWAHAQMAQIAAQMRQWSAQRETARREAERQAREEWVRRMADWAIHSGLQGGYGTDSGVTGQGQLGNPNPIEPD